MDGILLMPLQTSIGDQTEKLPLFQGAAERRPYQPYCVTEASSRCQSPDATYREPFRISYLEDADIADEAQNRNFREHQPDRGSFQYVTSSRGKYHGLAITPQTESKSQERHVSPDSFSQFWDTSLGDTNHITQAVAPRGSHSLASSRGTVCDGTLSHLRMQQSLSLCKATSQQLVRKPLPWYHKHARVNHHPLPSVPEETSPNSNDDEPGNKGHKKYYYRGSPAQNIIQTNLSTWSESGYVSKQQSLLHQLNEIDAQRSPVSTLYHQDHHQTSRHDISVEGESKYPNSTMPLSNASFREPSHSPEPGDMITKNAQLSSLMELYPSREQLPDTTEKQKAPKQTRPQDAHLKYQLGHPPSIPINHPEKTSRNHEIHLSLEQGSIPRSHPRKPLSSPSDTQSGPRPPPWGSYDSLAMQRQQRNEARGRIQLCTYRKQKDHAVTSHSVESRSSDTFGKDVVRREVDEYRRQVLSVYPELELDGAVKSQGGRWCCVVM